MIRPPHIAPQRIAPNRIAPPRIPPAIVPPPPPVYAPTPYLLEFLTASWAAENGAAWINTSLGNFVAAGHVSYDAQTPNDPSWSARLNNAEPSIAGDARIFGYVDPASQTNQAQMQVLKLNGSLSGYVALAVWADPAAGTVLLIRAINGTFVVIDSDPIGTVAQSEGLWLKIEDLGAGSVRARVMHKELGNWNTRCDITEATAATVATIPTWVFSSNNATPVLDAQIYHAQKFDGNRDASIVIPPA
jgi:hypothetical protein